MKTNLEEISPVKKKLLIEVDSQEVDRKLDHAYRELAKQAKIPGFRPGKIPRRILESRFGKQVEEDVTRTLINETFPKAIEEVETFPVGMPLLEKEALKQGREFRYSAVMEVKPHFEVTDYLGLEAEKEELTVTDEEVEQQLERIRESNGTLNSVEGDRPIQEGDYVVLDYEAFEGDRPLEDIQASNFILQAGSGNFHPRFEEALIGRSKDSRAEIPVDFENDYHHQALAGRSVTFKVHIRDIKKLELPELDDEFARNLGAETQSLDELREKVRESVTAQEENRIDREVKRRLLDQICATVDMELPQSMVQAEVDHAVERVKQNFARSGSSLEKAGLSEDKLKEEFRSPSERRVKDMLILSKIAEQENLQVSDEDLDKEFQKMAQNAGQDPTAIRRYYEARNLLDSLKEQVLEEKTLNYVLEHAKITKKDKNLPKETDSGKEE